MDMSLQSAKPVWWEAAPREPETDATLPSQCDCLVVGAGYAGLSAALRLAEAGRDVVVCDAGPAGFGGSSRSGGMIGHGHRLSYGVLIRKYGIEKARALVLEGMASLDHIKDLIRSRGLNAELQEVGRLRGAWTAPDYDLMGREADLLQRDFGLPVEVIAKADMHREIASDAYQGGLLFHSHGGVHPALYHQSLLAAARAAGARVFGYAPVTAIEPTPSGFRVTSSKGVIEARDVLLASNGYTSAPFTKQASALVTMPSFLIATQSISPNRVKALIPNGRMIVETREKHLYYRPSPDGTRIILGGRAALHPIPLEEARARLQHELVALFPDLHDVAITHVWTGNIAMTRSDLPAIGQRDGIWYALGCNGSGVALMTYLGHKLALKVLGDKQGDTAFDDIAFKPLPFYDGRPWFLRLMTYWFRARDFWRDHIAS